MYHEKFNENLLDEVTRLVGRPVPVVADALCGVLGVLIADLPIETARELSPFPLTSWQALAPEDGPARQIWGAAVAAGLTAEEVFTVLAVVDDHVRRRYGADAWVRVHDWAPRLAVEYDFSVEPASAPLSTAEPARAI